MAIPGSVNTDQLKERSDIPQPLLHTLLLHCITQNLHTHTESDLATTSPENETVDAEDRPEAVQEEEEMWTLRASLKQFKRKKDQ